MAGLGYHLRADGTVTSEFGQLMEKLAAGYPTTGNLSTPQVLIYARALGDIPLDSLRRACAIAIRDAKFFPSVAELRSYIVPSGEDAALIAWTAFCEAAEEVGSWSSLEVEDGAAGAALETVFGSWTAFCGYEVGPELGAKRQEFLVAYRDARRTAPPARRLLGACEATGQYKQSGEVWVARIAAGRVLACRDGQSALSEAPKGKGELSS